MNRFSIPIICLLFLFTTLAYSQSLRYSTGCVRDYIPNGCGGPDLPATIPEGANFSDVVQSWWLSTGFILEQW